MMPPEDHIDSYDVGRTPYKHDDKRGKWATTTDFYLACIGHAFGSRSFGLMAAIIGMGGGVAHFIPLIITILLISVPIIFVQSALGQFSSTGCISVFRMAPLFKGVGYIIMILNVTSATFYSVITAYHLLYIFSSFQIEFPWMSCNHSWNSENCSTEIRSELTSDYGKQPKTAPFAPTEFLAELVQSKGDGTDRFSWPVLTGTMIVWLCVYFVLLEGIKSISRIIRYSTIVPIIILSVMTVRCLFLDGAFDGLGVSLFPNFSVLQSPLPWVFAIGANAVALGSGWATVLTLASYNNFRTNVEKYSFAIPFSVMGLSFISGIFITCFISHLEYVHKVPKISFNEGDLDINFVGFAYFISSLEASHLWSFLFFFMMFLLELNSLVVQTFTLLTGLFDEYVHLRPKKRTVTAGACGGLFLLSIVYAKGGGLILSRSLQIFAAFTQLAICFFELMVYVWVYGRQRFLRDMQFMLERPFQSWKFYILRFISPTFIIFITILGIVASVLFIKHTFLAVCLIIIMKVLPWIFIPGYALYKLYTATGTFIERLKKSIKPTDWFPADPALRQKYEVSIGRSDTSHQLVEMASNNDLNCRHIAIASLDSL